MELTKRQGYTMLFVGVALTLQPWLDLSFVSYVSGWLLGAAYASDRKWHPSTTMPKCTREVEEKGLYTTNDGSLWFFMPTHWREKKW